MPMGLWFAAKRLREIRHWVEPAARRKPKLLTLASKVFPTTCRQVMPNAYMPSPPVPTPLLKNLLPEMTFLVAQVAVEGAMRMPK